MWVYAALGLLGACGLLYGLWQRSRASGLALENSRLTEQNKAQEATLKDTVSRYESALAQKDAQLTGFRKEMDALPDSALRSRFNFLFPPEAKA